MHPRTPAVVLDACVLANQTVADLMLRLAEDPAMIYPRWSEEILAEVRRTHRKLGWPDALAESWQADVVACFPEAAFTAPPWVVARLRNHPKDRHVLGTAIVGKADTIITFNLRDFPPAALAAWSIRAIHPDDFMQELLRQRREQVIGKVAGMAKRHGPAKTLEKLGRDLPALAHALARTLSQRG